MEIYFVEDNEKFPLTGSELVSMNLVGFTPPFFDNLREGFTQFVKNNIDNPKAEFFLPDAITSIIKINSIKMPVIETPELTYGVTYQEDKPIVTEMIKQQVESGIYPDNLWT